jgi:hypothetical protein
MFSMSLWRKYSLTPIPVFYPAKAGELFDNLIYFRSLSVLLNS